MSTPASEKKATQIGNLTPSETKLLLLGSVCSTGEIKMDFEKLAALAGIKKASANSMWGRARQKLEKAIEAEDGAENNSPTKPKATPKPKAAAKPKAAPKTKPAAKRRKRTETPETEPSPSPEPESENEAESEPDDEPEPPATPEANVSGTQDEPSA